MGITDKQKFVAFPDSRHTTMFAHIYDMALRSDREVRSIYGDFLSENSIGELLSRASLLPCVPTLFGGFDDAERKMVAFISPYEEPSFPICAVKLSSPRIKNLTHRDFLGSVLGLGIKREKCGDILIGEDACFLILHEDIASFVANSLTKVGREGVKAQVVPLCDVVVPPKSFTDISGTVASMRLDSIVSLFVGKGRSASSDFISAGLVFVNGVCTLKNDMRICDGDIISVRSKGKATVKKEGLSKKDRIFVTLSHWK